MDTTWPYIAFGIVMLHIVLGIVWLMYKMGRKK